MNEVSDWFIHVTINWLSFDLMKWFDSIWFNEIVYSIIN